MPFLLIPKSYSSRLRGWMKHVCVFLDLAFLRLRYPFLARIPAGVNGERKVLLVSLTERVSSLKIDGFLLKALQMKGCTPVVLTFRSNMHCRLYCRAFGIRDFLYLDDLVSRARNKDDDLLVQEILENHLSFSSLLAYTHDGVHVGKNVLSTVIRKFRKGSLSLEDPETLRALEETIRESLSTGRAAKALFEREHFEAVLFYEKGYTPHGEVFDRAVQKNLNIISYAHAHKLNGLIMKRFHKDNRGIHHWSVSKKTWDMLQDISLTSQQEDAFMQEYRDGYEQGTWFRRNAHLKQKDILPAEAVQKELGLDPSKKTAVVFSHILWDATFFYGKTLFRDYEEWLVETVKVACKNTAVNWVIKLHPDYTWKMHDMGPNATPSDIVALSMNIESLPDHVKVVHPGSHISTYSYLSFIDYAITVRGTIGIETPCFGIPVITAGTGRYSGLGITVDSDTREQYLDTLRTIQTIPALTDMQRSLARKHAYTLFNWRIFWSSSYTMKNSVFAKLCSGFDNNIAISLSSYTQLLAAPDLRRFANWVIDSDDDDYLHIE